jgi:hypothetical protein
MTAAAVFLQAFEAALIRRCEFREQQQTKNNGD